MGLVHSDSGHWLAHQRLADLQNQRSCDRCRAWFPGLWAGDAAGRHDPAVQLELERDVAVLFDNIWRGGIDRPLVLFCLHGGRK